MSDPPLTLVLLTWHGRVVVREPAGAVARHEQLSRHLSDDHPWQVRPPPGSGVATFTDWVGWGGVLTLDLPGRASVRIAKRPGDRLVTLRSDSEYATATDTSPILEWTRREAGPWERYLALDVRDLERLRRLCCSALRGLMDDRLVESHRVRPVADFRIAIGEDVLPIHDALAAIDDAWLFRMPDRPVPEIYEVLDAGDDGSHDVLVRDLPADQRPRPATDAGGFLAGPDATLDVSMQGSSLIRLPVMLSKDDERQFTDRYYQGLVPPLGTSTTPCHIHREAGKYVLLTRYAEGVILDRRGSLTSWGFLNNVLTLPAPFVRKEGSILMSPAILERCATPVERRLVVFYNGNLQNYYHWIVEAMLPLDILARHRVPDTALLLPGHLKQMRGFDHLDVMATLGLGDWPIHWSDDDVVRAEEVVWLEGGLVEQVPHEHVLAFNRRIRARFATEPGPTRRIYIRRVGPRGIVNAAEIEGLVRSWGFHVHTLEHLTFARQLELFCDAEFVIAPHGAGLSNIIFCPPGARVLEIMPHTEVRPFFWLLAEKVGLRYGMLHCSGGDGGTASAFNDAMYVDPSSLHALYNKLSNVVLSGLAPEGAQVVCHGGQG